VIAALTELASATRLASRPLFTLSNRGETEKVTCRWSDLRFAAEGKALIVEGTVAAKPEAYAAIAYLDPDGKSDYDTGSPHGVRRHGRVHRPR